MRFRNASGVALRLHDLRHSHSALLFVPGVPVPVKVVSERLDYSTCVLTLDT